MSEKRHKAALAADEKFAGYKKGMVIKMEKSIQSKYQFKVSDKDITIYSCDASDGAVIYLNTFAEEGDEVYQMLQKTGCPDFTLVAINGFAWNHDMAPWAAPSVFKDNQPFTGGADGYLELLTNEIVPKAEHLISTKILWRGLAGYSLAGLFAIYSLYKTALFSRAASISGSLWFPGFREYALSHEMKGRVEHLYLSLGDKECKTKNPYLKTVQEHTEAIRDFYTQKGIDTAFECNPGSHFKNAAKRTAMGVSWLVKR